MAQYRQSGLHYANGSSSDHVSIAVRGTPHQQQKPGRIRRSGRSVRGLSIGSVIVVLSCVLLVTVFAYYFLLSSTDSNELNNQHIEDDDMKNDVNFLSNITRMDTFKVVGFGKGVVSQGRDSRYWDKDDRRRDDDYNGDDMEHASNIGIDESTEEDRDPVELKSSLEKDNSNKGVSQKGVGLYNENGRKELRKYEQEYQASLKNAGESTKDDEDRRAQTIGLDDEYDDGVDLLNPHLQNGGEFAHEEGNQSDGEISNEELGRQTSNFFDAQTKDQKKVKDNGQASTVREKASTGKSHSDSKKKPRRRKYSGCDMKLLNSTTNLVEPFESRKFARFSLQYVEKEDKSIEQEDWEPRFAGHQSLEERKESFVVHDQQIKCGFVKGPEGSPSTGFDLSEDDENYISRCHIAVISCIFGNSDRLRTPATKMVTRLSRKNVCFVMFMDEITLQTLSSEGHMPDREGFIGLWKIVVVKNLPYSDMRRVGKIPKLIPHRLFPSARYSIWLDSKLRLQLDPLLILEYLLWRKGYEYAISNHYDRHCVWEEVAQNKKLNKYNHTVIDEQFAFYQADGLTRFNVSDPNRLLPSNVPEGSLIVRAHTPMSNLFSCLWFNEVERFTPRDQLSFAYTYQKLRLTNPGKPFYLHMFKDCERRAIAKLFRHRSEEKRNALNKDAIQ